MKSFPFSSHDIAGLSTLIHTVLSKVTKGGEARFKILVISVDSEISVISKHWKKVQTKFKFGKFFCKIK